MIVRSPPINSAFRSSQESEQGPRLHIPRRGRPQHLRSGQGRTCARACEGGGRMNVPTNLRLSPGLSLSSPGFLVQLVACPSRPGSIYPFKPPHPHASRRLLPAASASPRACTRARACVGRGRGWPAASSKQLGQLSPWIPECILAPNVLVALGCECVHTTQPPSLLGGLCPRYRTAYRHASTGATGTRCRRAPQNRTRVTLRQAPRAGAAGKRCRHATDTRHKTVLQKRAAGTRYGCKHQD
jgi:hypothetical protein